MRAAILRNFHSISSFPRYLRHIFTIDLSLLVSWVNHLGELRVDVRIILKWVFKKSDVEVWTELIRFKMGHSTTCCVCGNEFSGSIK